MSCQDQLISSLFFRDLNNQPVRQTGDDLAGEGDMPHVLAEPVGAAGVSDPHLAVLDMECVAPRCV